MSASSSFEEWIGQHRMCFEAPDLLSATLRGPLTVEEAETIVRRVHEIGQEHEPLFLMLGVEQYESSGERVRQVFTSEGGSYPIRAGVIWGASFTIRVAMSMVLTAGARIMPSRFSFPVKFVATEAEARAFLLAQRPAASGRAGGSYLATG